jgi:hypothetical protein
MDEVSLIPSRYRDLYSAGGFAMPEVCSRSLAQTLEDIIPLHQLCRDGRLYEVERWIADGKPLQVTPGALPKKGRQTKTALQIALDSGNHSLAYLLLRNGYRLELEKYGPLDLTLSTKRWDLFELLLEWGGDLRDVDVETLLNTYNTELYERFFAAGYDLTARHEMASALGYSTSNRPLYGFVKRHRGEDPRLQRELDIALGYQSRRGNERGVALCLWAGADPHAVESGQSLVDGEETEPDEEEESYLLWSAISEAARAGYLGILKRLGPDPARDDFDELYENANDESIVAYLMTMQPPKDLTRILSRHFWWLGDCYTYAGGRRRGIGVIEAILDCGVRWEEKNLERLGWLRHSLLRAGDSHLKAILIRLEHPDICAPETYHELVRTPKMQARLISLGIKKKPVTEREKRAAEREKQRAEREKEGDEVRWLLSKYDRNKLYDQVWAEPALTVAKGYGFSSVWLGKVCRRLKIPVPPRGYWARVRSVGKGKKPPLPDLGISPK